jgi:DNA (cytosine-5)-methyltransferase 1
MKLISLFSGIGGFELAAEWMGWTPIVSCEINPFGRQVLEHYWPNAYHHDDIHTLTNETITAKLGYGWNDGNTILTGGFPCQPYSLAGKRLGKEDDRHLWPEMLRVIREVQPRWVVGENVFGIVNWDGGLVFDEVQADLEAEGYEVQAYVLPAAAVNAPHRRDRVWFVAFNSNNTRGSAGLGQVSEADGEIPKRNESAESCDASSGHAANTNNKRLERRKNIRDVTSSGQRRNEQSSRLFRTAWAEFPTQSPIRDRNDGLSDRLAGITVPKWRQESIKAMGNAIVPQVALQIFKTIEAYEKSNP